MSSDHWAQLRDTIEEALKLPRDERLGFINNNLEPGSSLHRQAALLLHDLAQGDPVDDSPDAPIQAEAFSINGRPQKIGHYLIEETLGEGGMGMVYLARDEKEFARKVALKVVKPTTNRHEVFRQFQKERQILASLIHPNIAQLYGGGATVDGLPYFAMEFVEGEPIDQYCHSRKLTVTQRLNLFRKVCDAVSFAHAGLVIHRDLKPCNILVTPRGEPKLLDFGIAGLINPTTLSQHTMTLDHMQFMTPAYASPEQYRGERLTAASDVYTLGIVLYQILTGALPYDLNRVPPHEVHKIICELDPEKPSKALKSRTVSGVGENGLSGVHPSNLPNIPNLVNEQDLHLPNDIDNIVLKALRKSPNERYNSVEQLSSDIGNYLANKPVTARNPTLGYRVGKFVRRHRLALFTAACFLIVLTGFTLSTINHEKRTARERDIATLERDTAAQVTEFLTNLFEVVDPDEARGETITAKEILDKGASTIADELKDQPETRARLLEVMGRVYKNLGLFTKSEDLLRESLAVIRTEPNTDTRRLADTVRELGTLNLSQARFDEAEALFQEALDLRRRQFGDPHPDIAESLADMGSLRAEQGRFDEARDFLNQAATMYAAGQAGENEENVAGIWESLGIVDWQLGNHDASEQAFNKALEIYRRIHGETHLSIARTLGGLALLSSFKGAYKEATRLNSQVLEMNRKILGDIHPQVGTSLNNLAHSLLGEGNLAAAESLYRESIEVGKKVYTGAHPSIAISLNNLAFTQQELGDYEKAESAFREALEMQKSLHAGNHQDVALALNNLGYLLKFKGSFHEAEPLIRQAIDMLRAVKGDSHPNLADMMCNLADLLMEKGDTENALILHRDAYAMRRRFFDGNHPDLARSLNDTGLLLWEMGRSNEAEPMIRQSLTMRRSLLGDVHPDVGVGLTTLARVLIENGSVEEGRQMAEEAIAIFNHKFKGEHDKTAFAQAVLGYALVKQGHYQEAEPLLKNAYKVIVKRRGKYSIYARWHLNYLVEFYNSGNQTAAAERCLNDLKLLENRRFRRN